MLKLREIVPKDDETEQLDEATNALPALLVLKRGTIRVMPDGKRIALYSHDSGFSIIFPLMFSKGEKR